MQFYSDYFDEIAAKIKSVEPAILEHLSALFEGAQAAGRKVILVGNGGSAAMASHVAVDLTKVAGIRAHNFNEADLLTCLANDFGYEHWVEKALEFYGTPDDVAVLISSSGRSPNIVNGARKALASKMKLVTFSGFGSDNPLRQLGELNFWVDSKTYNVVEMTHQAWLLAAVDRVVSRKVPLR
jgi:D-sedoheptulose 7-phosphate isomerase